MGAVDIIKLILNMHIFSFNLILFLLISSNVAFSHGAKKPEKLHHVVHIASLMPKPNCLPYKTGLRSHKVKLSHRYGPCSPFLDSMEIPSSDEILLKNEARVRGLNSRISNSYSTMDELDGKSLQARPSLGDGAQYITTIGIGTPKVDYKVMIDTGSDSTWIRCKPCHRGCDSKGLLFDPLKSSTYINSSDSFHIIYGDSSSSTGQWGYDTLTIEPADVINKFRFGCGQYIDQDDDFAHADGVLGLGRGVLSLVSQSASKFGKIFGYCFPKSEYHDGYLVFGDEAKRTLSSSTLKFTKLLTNPPHTKFSPKYIRDSLYFLQLVGISVAGERLNISSDVFTSVGTIIDSGTVVTHLPKLAYNALSTVFKKSMSKYSPAPRQEVLDTCYIVKANGFQIPSVTFHFAGGTDVDLDQSGIGWTAKKNNIWCLGFAANENEDDLTIIGNTQQREMEVLYDLDAGRIGFGKKSCGS